MRRIVVRVDPAWDDILAFPLLGKPKWMRWATFSRHYAEWQRADQARNEAFNIQMARLLWRINPALLGRP